MVVYVNNLHINCGENFSQELTILGSDGSTVNLTGYAGSSHMRKHAESSVVVAGFGISFFNRNEGIIKLLLSKEVTSGLKEGRYVYDVLLTTNTNRKILVVEGTVLVRAGITT